jgi:hypothetical protein
MIIKAAIFTSGILLFLSGCYLSLYGAMNLSGESFVEGIGAIVLGLVIVRVIDKEEHNDG